MIDFIKNFRYNKDVKDKEKRLKQIAEKIAELELKCQKDPDNANKYVDEITNIANNLSISDMLELDVLIQNKLTQ